MWRTRAIAVVVGLTFATAAHAQIPKDGLEPAAGATVAGTQADSTPAAGAAIRTWRPSEADLDLWQPSPSVGQTPLTPMRGPKKPRSRATKAWQQALAGAAMGFGGFLAGGFLGAKIEGDRCNCDDPGFRGFFIGAPIGAAAGAVTGVWLLR